MSTHWFLDWCTVIGLFLCVLVGLAVIVGVMTLLAWQAKRRYEQLIRDVGGQKRIIQWQNFYDTWHNRIHHEKRRQ